MIHRKGCRLELFCRISNRRSGKECKEKGGNKREEVSIVLSRKLSRVRLPVSFQTGRKTHFTTSRKRKKDYVVLSGILLTLLFRTLWDSLEHTKLGPDYFHLFDCIYVSFCLVHHLAIFWRNVIL